MSAYYSSQEMANMHFMCDRANRNPSAAQRIIARLCKKMPNAYRNGRRTYGTSFVKIEVKL